MALFEDVLGGWAGGGILVGVGAILVLPVAVPVVGSVLRPVVRTIIGTGFAIADGVSGVIAEGYDQVSGLVAEARSEMAAPR
jgi:hypothetical protein